MPLFPFNFDQSLAENLEPSPTNMHQAVIALLQLVIQFL